MNFKFIGFRKRVKANIILNFMKLTEGVEQNKK